MKYAIAVFIVVLIMRLIVWMRGDEDFPIVQAAPLVGGFSPGIYDIAGGAMLLIAIWGVSRMWRGEKDE